MMRTGRQDILKQNHVLHLCLHIRSKHFRLLTRLFRQSQVVAAARRQRQQLLTKK